VVVEGILDDLGMRIDYGNPVAGGNVGRDDIPHQGALACAGRSKQSKRPTTGGRNDAYRPALMERIFTTANQHRMKRHPESIKCKRKNGEPRYPQWRELRHQGGDRSSNTRQVEETQHVLPQARSSHGLPMLSHKCNVP